MIMIQIDMEMPKSCAVCRFNSRCDDCEHVPNYCMAADFKDNDDARIGYFNDGTHEYDPEIGFTPEYSRMEWCPLKEVKHGKWVDNECTNCGYIVRPWNNTPFCPNCGVRMDGWE